MDLEPSTDLPSTRFFRLRKRRRVSLLIGASLFACILFGFIQKSPEIFSPPTLVSLRVAHPDFIGRKPILKKLEKDLLPERWRFGASPPVKVRNLWGIGGMGKSELAVKFANEHLGKFSLVWLFHCESDEQIIQGYHTLAERLGIYVDKKNPPDVVKQKVHAHLEEMRGKPWLLIYDNVEREWGDDEIPNRGGIVLITSRESSVRRNPEECLLVPSFSEQEGVHLLAKVTGEEKTEEMGALVQALYGYPLVVNQAAHLIRETPSTDIKRCLVEFAEGSDLLSTPISEDNRYGRTFEAVWKVTLDKLRKECPLAVDFLEVCSYYAPDNIPIEWFEESEEFGEKTAEILRRLQHLALITYNRETRSFDFHRLLRRALQLQQTEPAEQATKAIDLLVRNANFSWRNSEGWDWGLVWPSHASSLLANFEMEEEINPELFAQLCFKAAEWAYIFGEDGESIRYIDLSLKYGSKPLFISHLYLLKGVCLDRGWELKKAVEVMQKGVRICEEIPADGEALLGMILSQMASTYCRIGEYDRAFQAVREGIKLLLPFAKQYPEELAIAYGKQAFIFFREGKNHQDVDSLKKGLACLEQVGRKGVLAQTALYAGLSCIYVYMGEGEKAVHYSTLLNEIYQKILHHEHPFNRYRFTNEIEVCRSIGEYKKGIELGKEGLNQSRLIFIVDGQAIAFIYSNMGHCFLKVGQLDNAISYHEQALEKLFRLRGESHLDIARGRRRLARALREVERFDDAMAHLDLAESFLIETFPYGHPVLAAAWKDRGACLLGLGKPEEGLLYCEKALAFWQKTHPEGHPQEAKTLQVMGRIYEALGEPSLAAEAYMGALKVAHKKYRRGHPDLKEHVADLASLENFEAVRKEKEVLLPIVKEVLGPFHSQARKLASI